MRRIAIATLVLLLVAGSAVEAKTKSKSKSKATSAPASSSTATTVARPAAPADQLTPLVLPFETNHVLAPEQVAVLVAGLEGWNYGRAAELTALKVQNRTSRYAAVLLHVEDKGATLQRIATWVLTLDAQGHRQGAKILESRETAEDHISGVKGAFDGTDRFTTQEWSAYSPSRQDPALNEGTPEHWRISEDGRISEDTSAK